MQPLAAGSRLVRLEAVKRVRPQTKLKDGFSGL